MSVKVPHINFLKKAFMLGTGNVLGQAIAFIFFVLLARWLSKDSYGEIRYIISLSGLLGTILAAGLPASMTRFLAYHPEKEEKERYFTNILGLFLIMLLATEIILVIVFRNELIITLVVLGYSIPLLYLGVVRGLMQYGKYSLVQALRNLIKLPLLLAIFYSIGVTNLRVLLIYSFAGWGAILILELLWPSGIKFRPDMISRDVMKRVLIFSIPVLTTTIAYSIIISLPVLLLKWYVDYETVAIYSAAFTVTAAYGIIPAAILTIIMPKIASTTGKEQRMQLFKNSVYIIVSTGILLFIATVFFGRWALKLVFTSKYDASYIPLVILSIGAIFITIRRAYSALWEGGGKPIISAYEGGWAVVVTTIVALLIIPSMGATGAALAFTAGGITATAISTYFFYKWKKNLFHLK